MARRMGLDFGLESEFPGNPGEQFAKAVFGLSTKTAKICKRKFRWLFKIPDVSADGVNSLPPSKGARPSISFKEIEVKHLNEDVFYPGKPDWKPINLVLYDLKKNKHPVFEWIKNIYNPKEEGLYKFAVGSPGLFKDSYLELYDGCGATVETWKFENSYPSSVDFSDLDMQSSEICMCNLILRYSRAYIEGE